MAREPPVLSEIPVDLVGATLEVARAAQANDRDPPGRGADMPAPVIASQCSHWRGNPSLPAETFKTQSAPGENVQRYAFARGVSAFVHFPARAVEDARPYDGRQDFGTLPMFPKSPKRVILSAAKDLSPWCMREQKILRFAQNDKF